MDMARIVKVVENLVEESGVFKVAEALESLFTSIYGVKPNAVDAHAGYASRTFLCSGECPFTGIAEKLKRVLSIVGSLESVEIGVETCDCCDTCDTEDNAVFFVRRTEATEKVKVAGKCKKVGVVCLRPYILFDFVFSVDGRG